MATKVAQFIALRISPPDMSIIELSNVFGMDLRLGMVCIALSIIVLAIALNLNQHNRVRTYVM